MLHLRGGVGESIDGCIVTGIMTYFLYLCVCILRDAHT